MFATAILGIVVGFVVAVVLWSNGTHQVVTGAKDVSAQFTELQRQITNLHNQVTASRAPGDIDALTIRVAKVEDIIANLPKTSSDTSSDVAQRIYATENAIELLKATVNALSSRTDGLAGQIERAGKQADATEKAVTQLRDSLQSAAKEASTAVDPVQLNAVQQRIAALEQSTKSLRADIARTTAVENSLRLALSANALRAAVLSGAPFQDELKQTKSLGADDKMLAPLEPFAMSGVPSAATLAQELRALIPAMQTAVDARSSGGGFFERLQANARKLVRIQPINAPQNSDPSAVLVRLEAAAIRTDIASALADLAELPEAVREPARVWIGKAHARQAALAAAQSFAAESARRLSPE
jgi:hypothetical protein